MEIKSECPVNNIQFSIFDFEDVFFFTLESSLKLDYHFQYLSYFIPVPVRTLTCVH